MTRPFDGSMLLSPMSSPQSNRRIAMAGDSWAFFQEEFERKRSQYMGAKLTAAVDLESGSARLITATLVFLEDAKQEDDESAYPGLELIRKGLSVEDGKSLAKLALLPGPEPGFRIKEHVIRTSGSSPWQAKRSSNESRFGIRTSSTEYFVHISDSGYGPNEVLAAEGLPVYPNAREAVKEWFGEWEGVDSWRGIFVVLPEYRAKIEDVVLEGQLLRVLIDRRQRGDAKAHYRVAYFARESSRVSKGQVELEGDVFEVDLGIAPTVLSVTLLAERAEGVDWRSVDLG